MAHDDRGVHVIQFPAERRGVGDQAAGHIGRGGLAAGRQQNGAAADAGALQQQLSGRLPPPLPVAHQGAVHEYQFHRVFPSV
jgi:hypothetical protein